MKEETIPTMDEVLAKHSSNFRKYLDKDYGSKFNVCINGFEAQNAMTEWQQITSAPLLAKIDELEKELVHHNTTINNLQNDLMERVNQITALQSSLKEKEGKCESNHLDINELLLEFQRHGFDTENWDGDEGAEKAIVKGVCTRIDALADKLTDDAADLQIERNDYRNKLKEKEKELVELKSYTAQLTLDALADSFEQSKQIEELKATVATQANTIRMIQEPNDTIEELKAENNRLKMDNMTHEYNQAEAEKFAPEYKKQIEEPLLAEITELKKGLWIAIDCIYPVDFEEQVYKLKQLLNK